MRTPRHSLIGALLAALLALTACGSDGAGGEGGKSTSTGKARKKGTPSAASSAPEPREGDSKAAMTWKGERRTYLVHAPPGYTPGDSLPLVIALHPYPSTGEFVGRLSGLSAKADEENFLVAYPEGHDSGYNAFVCCGSQDDVGFVRALAEAMTADWNADPDRIYATGISNGGDMSLRLAVELSDTFAAVAPVSGGFIGDVPQKDSYAPESPVSVITFIGGQDQYADQFTEGMALWTRRLKCPAGEESAVAKGNKRSSATCPDGSDVVVYRLPGMGHQWPGSAEPEMGEEETGIRATDLIWEFFKAHPKKRS